VGALIGFASDGRIFVLHVARGQWATDEVEEQVAAYADLDREDWGRCPVVIEAQPGAAGKMWNLRWQRQTLSGHIVELVAPQGSKVWRADAYSSTQRKGLVSLVSGDWNTAWVAEHSLFRFTDGKPAHRHDDQVDAGALGFNYLTGKGRKSKGGLASAARRQIG
jgi:predicted phage terminase large subunit-like protein